jgi:hypothetical protein
MLEGKMQTFKNKSSPIVGSIIKLLLIAGIILSILIFAFLILIQPKFATTNSQDPESIPDSPASPITEESANYYVSTSGSDANPGTQSLPWKTIQKAANSTASGGTTLVLAGTYNEQITVSTSGITLQAQGKVITKGVYIAGNSNTFRGFTITDPTSDWGIRTSGNYNLVEGNEIYHTKQDGIWFFGSYNTFRGNYIHDIQDPSVPASHVDCVQTWGWDWGATNTLFERNICLDNQSLSNTSSMSISRTTSMEVRDITFRNNIFIVYTPVWADAGVGSSGSTGISNISFINNTFVNYNALHQIAIGFQNITNPTAVNNLFIGYGDKNNYVPYIDTLGSTNVNIHNNAVYNSDGVPPYQAPYSGDIWMKDPRVVNLGTYDFHLQADSPLIDVGANLGSSVPNDRDGNSRPKGTGFDIGAYEYTSP